MRISFHRRTDYGHERFYADDDFTGQFMEAAYRRKSLSRSDIKRLKELGFIVALKSYDKEAIADLVSEDSGEAGQ